jgi:LysR family hydrogen peroxide-inducible transcriptional activator
MNIQQLEYIVAVDRLKHFAKAAAACNVTQPTLSMMIQKLEEELNVEVFDRGNTPVKTTPVGEVLVNQAKVILYNLAQFKEIAQINRNSVSGALRLAIIPTVAPYLLPKLFTQLRSNLPDLKCIVSEMRTDTIIEKLKNAETDLAILSTPLEVPSLLEIPVYYERFLAYISPEDELYNKKEISGEDLVMDRMWVLEEGHCFRAQMLNICHKEIITKQQYEAGSIQNLVKVVDLNGGYTLIPELHIENLSEEQKSNIRSFSGDEPRREVSLVFRQDFVRERLLNEMVGCIRNIIPSDMMDKRLSRFRVKL